MWITAQVLRRGEAISKSSHSIFVSQSIRKTLVGKNRNASVILYDQSDMEERQSPLKMFFWEEVHSV